MSQVNEVLGPPVSCAAEPNTNLTQCEYRTAMGRNLPTPDVHVRIPSMGPDLSPYDHFDVLHLHFDDTGVARDWTPMVIRP